MICLYVSDKDYFLIYWKLHEAYTVSGKYFSYKYLSYMKES